jgi:hypothetical protein
MGKKINNVIKDYQNFVCQFYCKQDKLAEPQKSAHGTQGFSRAVQRVLKANSHKPCRSHAAPLPFSDSAVSFVKVRLVARNIRTASPTV